MVKSASMDNNNDITLPESGEKLSPKAISEEMGPPSPRSPRKPVKTPKSAQEGKQVVRHGQNGA
jgi:hypothetical protein